MNIVNKTYVLRHLLAGAAIAGLATAAQAQEQPAPEQANAEQGNSSDIIVTATRRNERLQDVPMNVTAITSADLQKNNVTRFEEVAKLSPGLNLATNSNGPAASLRGVSTVTVSGGPPAVDVYFNESPLNGLIAFRSVYDIGQVEVLRGPQGTLRGNTAPTGAITIATKRPDLNEFGGMASIMSSKRDRWGQTGQAAVNVPLVKDMLAVRVAGFFDRNDLGGVHNPATGAESRITTKSYRASVLFKPFEALEIMAMYQYLRDNQKILARVEGTGYQRKPADPAALQSNYNGPAIDGSDNRAVQEQTELNHFTAHVGSLVAKLDLGEATINYIGGYRKQTGVVPEGGLERDPGNGILNLGRLEGSSSTGPIIQWTHELRLDSAGANRFWDYTLGFYHESAGSDVLSTIPQVALPGAFGVPAPTPPSGPLNYRYVSNLNLHLYGGDNSIFAKGNSSVFASSTFNFGTGTHLRLGARRIWANTDNNFVLGLSPAFAALPLPCGFLPFIGIPSAGAVPSVTYPGACDVPGQNLGVPTGTIIDQHSKRKFKAWVYDINLRQEITPDLMVYASYGRNWRAPGLSQGNVPAAYFLSNPEVSKNYEIGAKGQLFDRRVRFSAAVFQQDFKNYSATVSNVPFRDPTSTTGVTDAFSLTYNGDARVRGFEATVSGNITDQWTAGASVSYAKSNFKNARQPCRDANFDGIPDSGSPTAAGFDAAGVITATCLTNGAINGQPKWTYNLQSEYTMPVGEETEAYVRGLFNWRGKGLIVASAAPIRSYGTLDLYGGVRIGTFDISVFGKNVFDVERKIDQSGFLSAFGSPNGLGGTQTGYRQVYYTAGREVGVNVRWSFGGG